MDSKGQIIESHDGKKPAGGTIPLAEHEVRYLKNFKDEDKGFELTWYRYKHNFLLNPKHNKGRKYTPIELGRLKLACRFGYWFHSFVTTGVMPAQMTTPVLEDPKD